MNKVGNVTLCAMMAALASVFMLTSYFPYLTYAIPAVAGLFIMIAVIETDLKWAFISYAASAVIVGILAEPEAKMLYILFFGYYPIVKALFERLKSRVLEYVFKFSVFNIAVILAYTVVSILFKIDVGEMGDFGRHTAVVLIIAANIVFPVYDIAVSRMAQYYSVKLHPTVYKIFRGKQ